MTPRHCICGSDNIRMITTEWYYCPDCDSDYLTNNEETSKE